MSWLRIFGDVHGDWRIEYMTKYLELAKNSQYSVQLGDLSFQYDALSELDSDYHKVLGGNHDNYYDVDGKFIHQTSHFLGDFGVYKIPDSSLELFYVRGGHTIDQHRRVEGLTWFPKEELSYSQVIEVLNLYERIKPDFVISHECPAFLMTEIAPPRWYFNRILKPSKTANFLDQMWEIHQPKMWLFGHHHLTWRQKVGETQFICLNILDYIDLEKDFLSTGDFKITSFQREK